MNTRKLQFKLELIQTNLIIMELIQTNLIVILKRRIITYGL